MSEENRNHKCHHKHGNRDSGGAPSTAGKYTCPMHPEIQQDHPGDCPKCGMPLEAKTVTAESGAEAAEIRSLSGKFRIGAALTPPVLVIAMGHWIPGFDVEALVPKSVSKWIEFALTTPVVLWAGGMFFTKSSASFSAR